MAQNCSYNISSVQEKPDCGDLRKNHDFQMTAQHLDQGTQNVTNLQTSASNPPLLYQNTSFTGFYSSPGLNNSFSGFENNIQWLTDNRITNQHNQLTCGVITDKNINNTTHALTNTTSHSCCVNRFGVLDSLGMSSPDQGKPSCDIAAYQNKSMNMIDPIQSWLNFQMPPQMTNNQQYCKYTEKPLPSQNFNIPVSLSSQINIPILEQTDMRQNDMAIQSQDQCFQNVDSINIIKPSENQVTNVPKAPHLFSSEEKQILGSAQHINGTSGTPKQHSSYQPNLQSKEWKSTFQNMSSYIQSPNVFGSVNENQENFVFPQFSVPSTKLYYPPVDSYQIISKCNDSNLACMNQTEVNCDSNMNRPVTTHSSADSHVAKLSITQNDLNKNANYLSKPAKQTEADKVPYKNDESMTFNAHRLNSSLSDCCQSKTPKDILQKLDEIKQFSQNNLCQESQSTNAMYINKPMSLENIDHNQISNKSSFRISESSESDESNIIVEESDDIGEIESEISIEEIKKSYQENGPSSNEVQLRCVICNSATCSKIPPNQFIHLNNSFPLLAASKTPVCSKLEEILPLDIQDYLKSQNTFLCRRCLNLVESVEVLEVKLKTTKEIIKDNFIKTLQLVAPELDLVVLKSNIKLKKSESLEHPFPKEDVSIKCSETDLFVEDEDNQECVEVTEDVRLEGEFKCRYCFKVLSSQNTLDLHLQQHTNEFSFYCEKCGKGFPLKTSLQKHLLWHSGISRECPILCDKCGDTFNTKDLFNSHNLKVHSQEFKFKCDTCGKGFTRKVSLEIHRHKHTGERPYICEYCGFTFQTEGTLKNHIKICTEDLPHQCDVCGKSFSFSVQLSRHKSQHKIVKDLMCPTCGKGFTKPSDLSRHMISHSSVKTFKCSDCDKSFKTMGNLNHHSKVIHRKELIFKCKICAKVLSKKSMLIDHEKSHGGEELYKCTKCDKSFSYQSTYADHLKLHENKVKAKTCEKCGKSIKTRMSIHMRTHTGEKPYLCTYCPKAFSVSQSLWKHVQRKHPTPTQ